MNKKTKIIIVCVLLILIGVVYALKQTQTSDIESKREEPAETVTEQDIAKNENTQALPRLVDLGADECIPCKMMAPVLEELKEEYGDKLDIYKVNTEEQRDLSAVFGIQSIPSLLFVPKDGQPQMAMGALPKETFKQAISEVLNVN